MHTRGLPGTLAPMYQESACDIEREVRDLGDVRHPGVLRVLGGLHAAQAALAQVADGVGDPVDVLLDRHDHVAEHRRAPGAGDEEQVREAGEADAEVGPRAPGPLVAQRDAVAAADVDRVQRTGHRVEARGEDDDVDRVGALAGAHALGDDLLERVGAEVDERHVVAVERLVVLRVHARALRAPRVRARHQGLGDRRVLDALADLAAEELGDVLVRGRVDHDVGEHARPCSARPPRSAPRARAGAPRRRPPGRPCRWPGSGCS